MQRSHTAIAALLVGLARPAFAINMPGMMSGPSIVVGSAAMYPSRNIIANALDSKDRTTLLAVVKAAGLVGALEGKGPFTVFAPANEAFADLPPGTVQSLLNRQNKAEPAKILEYHVVPGDSNTTKIRSMILAGGGTATLKTLEGGTLTLAMNGSSNIIVKDEKCNVADITLTDVPRSSGMIQVIDHVLTP
ncbi:MAG: fasciclin domain-containing protein [Rhodospirillales bacterium]|nr:fasciclin domain-containing protein [Rhodospirillales bacterium]